MKKPVMIDVSGVDWEELREQKRELFSQCETVPVETDTSYIEGILSLLDDIQDQAAKVLGNKVVFGKE